MQNTTLVSSIIAINTCYEHCFCVLVNEEPRNDHYSEVYFEHLCVISASLVISFSCNGLLISLLDNFMLLVRKHDNMISILPSFTDIITTRGPKPPSGKMSIYIYKS
jgi:hypothetical protein